jgi:hypothetical protein
MEQVASGERGQGRRAVLVWTLFLVAAVVIAAALIAGAIHGRLSPTDTSGNRPSLSGAPSPSPAPLPRPGPAPSGTLVAGP